MIDLIAVGDVMLDGSLPAPVEGERVHGRIELRAGGSAVGAAFAAARLGARAAVVGRIGADAAGRLISAELAAAGVEALLARDPDAATGCAFVIGGSSVVANPGAAARLSSDDVPATLAAGAVLVSGYSLLQPGSTAAGRVALARAKTECLAVDAASSRLVASFGVEQFFEATERASVLLANADEARALTGLEPEQAALALARTYRIACVKLGRAGAVAASGADVSRVEVEPVDPTDTFGAGDAFAGGFLFALARGRVLADALCSGCDAARALLLLK
ncbi:MAG TPA: PfkB family carbohydrate kinase [Gaiellaceae bacterium]